MKQNPTILRLVALKEIWKKKEQTQRYNEEEMRQIQNVGHSTGEPVA